MDDNRQHRNPSMPPHAIAVGDHVALGPPRHPGDMDMVALHCRQVKHVLQDLNQSITPPERWMVLQRALHIFSHDNIELHDREIALGIDKALCLKLGYVVITTQSTSVSQEISLICQCYLQIFKCASAMRLRSFREVGVTELLPILIQLWTNTIKSKIDVKEPSPEHDDAQTWMVRVLRVFSKLTPAKSCLINYLKGAYIGHLLRDMLIWMDKPTSSILYSSTDILWETLGLLKDLTFRSETDDKRILLTLEEGILFKTISVCCERIRTLHPRIQEWCTAVVWNLALDPSICHDFVSEKSAKTSKQNTILEGLLNVLIQYSADSSKSGFTIKIKRNATSAIGNIVQDPESQGAIFQNQTTFVSTTLIPQLMHLVQNDSDPVVRRRAMRTIRCLAGSTKHVTKDAVEKENIPSFLVDVIAQKTIENDEDDEDMQVQACQTVIALKEVIKVEIWSRLQTSLLDRIENATSSKVLSAATMCLSESFYQNESTLSGSCLSNNVWKNIERSVIGSSETHGTVSKLLLVLAKIEESTKKAETHDHETPSILTKNSVIHTLTTILLESESGNVDSRNQALQVVQILAESEINKKPLAENDRLLSSLVSLCLSQPDADEMKESAKRVIMQLVPEI